MKPLRGVALITVMLVVAIAALAATALLSSTSMAIHRTAALRDSEEGWWVARGIEAWVLGILAKDARESSYDGLDETWAQPVDHLPLDEGFVRGGIVDLQGRFNLNTLSPALLKQHPEYERQFNRLLLLALPNVQMPQGFVAAIQDWIDDDGNPGPGGAEDSTYMELDPPYRAANQPFTVVSELLAVRGVTPEIYAALRDLVCVLPEPRPINVNTADARVLAALSDHVDQTKLDEWIRARKDKPIVDAKGLQDWENQGVLGVDARPFLTYQTNYFQIQGEVFVGSSRVALYSSIRRSGANPTVLSHSADVE